MIRRLALCFGISFVAIFLGVSAAGGEGPEGNTGEFPLISTIAFTSTRDNPTFFGPGMEISLMNADGTNVRRLTENTSAEALPALSPDGKGRIVFDSNRLRVLPEPPNTSDLFLMNKFGEDQTFLTRGSSGSWSPDSKGIAYHRSASLTGTPIEPTQPGTATTDSDIFVIDNLGDFQDGLIQPRNLTNSPSEIDDDADWSPLGDKIVYVSKDRTDAINHPTNPTTAELFVRNADGTGTPTQLTSDSVEERAPTWSPDGTHILFMCRLVRLRLRRFQPLSFALSTLTIRVMLCSSRTIRSHKSRRPGRPMARRSSTTRSSETSSTPQPHSLCSSSSGSRPTAPVGSRSPIPLGSTSLRSTA
jgi:hypothetical protein